MPTIISQIEKLSLEDQLKLMHWIEKAIKNGRQKYRSTDPDPELSGKINCNLFADESSDWEAAK